MKTQEIPIKNIFIMLCYAWNVLAVKDTVKLEEERFTDVYNLLGRLLVFGTTKVIRQGINKSFVDQSETMTTVRGKLDLNETLKLRMRHQMRCSCNFEDFSKNNSFNQIVKYTLISSIHNETMNPSLKKDIKSLLVYFGDIDCLVPTKEVISQLRFNRNNQYYKMLISICVMLYKSTIVNEQTGKNTFKDFFREEEMQRVYELFILNFYAANLPKRRYTVHAPKIKWHLDNDRFAWETAFEVETSPGDRRTDIVVENRELNYQFIIDAKYYHNMLVKKYHSEDATAYRTSHINQIRGYILDSVFPGEKCGALLYPTVYSDRYDKGTMIPLEDAPIIMKTLNLNKPWQDIEADLLGLIHNIDGIISAKIHP